jgi:hypothetical protein
MVDPEEAEVTIRNAILERGLASIRGLLAAFLLAPVWGTVVAGEQQGRITAIVVRDSDGLIYFNLTGTPSGKPVCATYGYWIIRNENSETGKRQYALLLAAAASGKEMRVVGANTCTRWHDGEDVNFIVLDAE